MRPIKVITPATLRPVDLDTAKEHIHANQDSGGSYLSDEDTTATIYLDAAIRACENKLQANIMNAELEMYVKCWPGRCLELDKYPVSAVNSVKYYDDNGDLQTVGSSNYRLLDFMRPAVLEFDADFSEPSLDDREFPIIVNFNAGYTAASGVPTTIVHAVLLEFTDRYENRQNELAGSTVAMFSNAADNILAPERMWI